MCCLCSLGANVQCADHPGHLTPCATFDTTGRFVCDRAGWGGQRSPREGKPMFKAFSAQINLSSLLTHKPTSNFPISEAHHVCAKRPCFSLFPKLHRAPRDRGMAAEGTFQFPKAEKTRKARQTTVFLVTATRS